MGMRSSAKEKDSLRGKIAELERNLRLAKDNFDTVSNQLKKTANSLREAESRHNQMRVMKDDLEAAVITQLAEMKEALQDVSDDFKEATRKIDSQEVTIQLLREQNRSLGTERAELILTLINELDLGDISEWKTGAKMPPSREVIDFVHKLKKEKGYTFAQAGSRSETLYYVSFVDKEGEFGYNIYQDISDAHEHAVRYGWTIRDVKHL